MPESEASRKHLQVMITCVVNVVYLQYFHKEMCPKCTVNSGFCFVSVALVLLKIRIYCLLLSIQLNKSHHFFFVPDTPKVLSQNVLCGNSGPHRPQRNHVIECDCSSSDNAGGVPGRYLTLQKARLNNDRWSLSEVKVQLDEHVEEFSEIYGIIKQYIVYLRSGIYSVPTNST